MTVGKKIRDRRMELGLSQRDLAAKMGYSNQSAIARTEAGKVDLPLSRISQFAEVLGVSTSWLMGWEDSPETLGELAADVLLDAQIRKLVQGFQALGQEEKDVVLQLVDTFGNKKKPGADAPGGGTL